MSLGIIGGQSAPVSPFAADLAVQASDAARLAVGAHAMGADPHQVYIKKSDAIGTSDPYGAAVAAVAAHAMGVDPHASYLNQSKLVSAIDPTAQARAVLAAHAMAVNPHSQYPTIDQMMLADADTAGLVMSHVTSRAAHPDRPTFEQSVQFALFFGG